VSSFYVGPDRPALRVTNWNDLVAAAQAGVLTETQWVELKAALPAAAPKANLELARDLASLSVDGGVLVIGVRDPGQAAEDVAGTTDDLESLKSRISQVAVGRVQPSLNITLTPVRHPDDEARHVLLVTVPASASAPHMVDERYWGRSATGKRPLTDVEASRLWGQRRGARDDFEQRLRALPDDVQQLWPQPRQLGLAHLLVEPPLGQEATAKSLCGVTTRSANRCCLVNPNCTAAGGGRLLQSGLMLRRMQLVPQGCHEDEQDRDCTRDRPA
jgi:hypothetical protein